MQKFNALGNIEIDEKKGYALFSLNPKIYPINRIYSAVNNIIDKSCVILDGDPDDEALVEIRETGKEKIKKLVLEFNKLLVKK